LGIMLLVLTNTMLMAVRERFREYSILKALGFGARELAILLLTEAFLLVGTACVLVGAVLSVLFSLPPRQVLGALTDFFPVFILPSHVIFGALALACAIAVTASMFPLITIMRM